MLYFSPTRKRQFAISCTVKDENIKSCLRQLPYLDADLNRKLRKDCEPGGGGFVVERPGGSNLGQLAINRAFGVGRRLTRHRSLVRDSRYTDQTALASKPSTGKLPPNVAGSAIGEGANVDVLGCTSSGHRRGREGLWGPLHRLFKTASLLSWRIAAPGLMVDGKRH
jgi:hypothetical protein